MTDNLKHSTSRPSQGLKEFVFAFNEAKFSSFLTSILLLFPFERLETKAAGLWPRKIFLMTSEYE